MSGPAAAQSIAVMLAAIGPASKPSTGRTSIKPGRRLKRGALGKPALCWGCPDEPCPGRLCSVPVEDPMPEPLYRSHADIEVVSGLHRRARIPLGQTIELGVHG